MFTSLFFVLSLLTPTTSTVIDFSINGVQEVLIYILTREMNLRFDSKIYIREGIKIHFILLSTFCFYIIVIVNITRDYKRLKAISYLTVEFCGYFVTTIVTA